MWLHIVFHWFLVNSQTLSMIVALQCAFKLNRVLNEVKEVTMRVSWNSLLWRAHPIQKFPEAIPGMFEREQMGEWQQWGCIPESDSHCVEVNSAISLPVTFYKDLLGSAYSVKNGRNQGTSCPRLTSVWKCIHGSSPLLLFPTLRWYKGQCNLI